MRHKQSTSMQNTPVRAADLPAIGRLLEWPCIQEEIKRHGHQFIVRQLRDYLAKLRVQALQSELFYSAIEPEQFCADFSIYLQEKLQPAVRSMINLTGTVLHTNLGRALLPEVAVQKVVEALTSPLNLEYNLVTGKRGDRDDLIEQLLCELTGAEAATVVNNNAAAVLLMLNTMALGQEVVVSRGELVEIGGAFRIPDIMTRAAVKLVEVGTTNRTHPFDYENAITDQTKMLMQVHCSNYEVVGFTKSVSLNEMVAIGNKYGIPTTVDLGSGTLVDLTQWGLPFEPTVRQTIEAGADVVTFSGDKLLGGPQAGLIVGRKKWIDAIKKNPLKRALRVGKLTLAALEPVLQLYRSPELLAERLTTLTLLTRPQEQMHKLAVQLQPLLAQKLPPGYTVRIESMHSQIGSGAMPVDLLPSFGLVISAPSESSSGSAIMRIEKWLRTHSKPIVGRIHKNELFLDLRCLSEKECAYLHRKWGQT